MCIYWYYLYSTCNTGLLVQLFLSADVLGLVLYTPTLVCVFVCVLMLGICDLDRSVAYRYQSLNIYIHTTYFIQ